MTTNEVKIKPGMRLWFVPLYNYLGRPHEIVVGSVGRKWAKIEGDSRRRILIERMVVHGSDSVVGHVHEDRLEYEWRETNRQAWDGFVAVVRDRHRIPDGVTADDIAAARKLLGLEVKA